MPKLERLELCDNGIETGFDVIATQYPELKVLKVSGNKIKSLDEIKHLSGLEHLDSLDMVGNPVMGDPPKDTAPAADG
jgi:Leucine-rich repeat (LRR) protein